MADSERLQEQVREAEDYEPPALVELGSLLELTQGGAGSNVDELNAGSI